MSAFGLAKQLTISRTSAQEYINLYFQRYPLVKNYMDHIREHAHAHGYVETIFGRRLYLQNLNSKNGTQRQAAERTAINAPMQGSAADIIKRAMIDIDRWLQKTDIHAHLIMQVHDELVFEVTHERAIQLCEEIKLRMSHAASLDVPLVVNIGMGTTWDEAH